MTELTPAAVTPDDLGPLTVFYDGGCPLCRREISFYRRRRGADAIRWTDVSALSAETPVVTDRAGETLSQCDAMARFHVQTASGEIKSGAAAFAALWRGLPSFALLGHIASWRPITTVMEWGYRGFLKVRPALIRRAD